MTLFCSYIISYSTYIDNISRNSYVGSVQIMHDIWRPSHSSRETRDGTIDVVDTRHVCIVYMYLYFDLHQDDSSDNFSKYDVVFLNYAWFLYACWLNIIYANVRAHIKRKGIQTTCKQRRGVSEKTKTNKTKNIFNRYMSYVFFFVRCECRLRWLAG